MNTKITTLEDYATKLSPFVDHKPQLRLAAKEIATFLLENNFTVARKVFGTAVRKLNLAKWEQVAFSDLISCEREHITFSQKQ